MFASVVQALREGTNLNTPLADFVENVTRTNDLADVSGEVVLGQIFSGIKRVGEAVAAARSTTGKKKLRKKRKARKKTQWRTVTEKKARKTVRKKATKRSAKKLKRASRRTVNKRLDAVVKVIKSNGGWMPMGAIFAEASKNKALFKGVVPNTMTQYLGRITAEKSKRILRTGQRNKSRYKAV